MQLDFFDQTSNAILGAQSYGAFRDALLKAGCTKCGLSQSRTHIVIDRGNPAAKAVLIGEGPGADEDAQGKAFVGRAGKLLDRLCAGVGLDTNTQFLILNVVKCRPPENRLPAPEEADTCMPFLKKQLELVKPKVLVFLGATSVKYALGKKDVGPMESVVGTLFSSPAYPGATCMILYHPAFILRDPRKQPLFEQHLRTLKDYLVRESLLVA